MHIDEFGLVLRMPFNTSVLEVTDQLFLLRVDGDIRHTAPKALRRLRADMCELRVSIRMRSALDRLLRSLKAIAEPVEQLADGLVAHADPLRVEHFPGEGDCALRAPAQRRFRVTSCRRIDESLQRWYQFRMHILVLPSASALAPNVHETFGARACRKLVSSPLYSVQRQACRARYSSKSATPNLFRFRPSPKSRHALVHRAFERGELGADQRLGFHGHRRSRSLDPVDQNRGDFDQLLYSTALSSRLPCSIELMTRPSKKRSRR